MLACWATALVIAWNDEAFEAWVRVKLGIWPLRLSIFATFFLLFLALGYVRDDALGLQDIAGAFAVTFAVALAGAFAVGIGLFRIMAPDQAFAFVMFLMILPMLNALLDWLSWMWSRYLGDDLVASRAAGARGRLIGFVVHILLDLGAAMLLLFALAALLSQVMQAAIWLYADVIEFGVDAWPAYLCAAAREPLGQGFWATSMLFSTLIPTVLHLAFVLLIPFIWFFGGRSELWQARGAYLLGGPVPAPDWPSGDGLRPEAERLLAEKGYHHTTYARVASRHIRFRLLWYPLAVIAAGFLLYLLIHTWNLATTPLPHLLLTAATLDPAFATTCLAAD